MSKKINVTLIPGDGSTHRIFEDVEIVNNDEDGIKLKFLRPAKADAARPKVDPDRVVTTTVESNLKYIIFETLEHSKSVTI